MKKITYLFALLLMFVCQSYGQLTEDFEGTWPPTGWTIESTNTGFTWEENVSGITGKDAHVGYDFAQDESLISPVFTVPAGTPTLKFKLSMSYFWGVDPNNNYDIFVSISTDGGTTWAPIWDESSLGVFANWTPIDVSVPLTTYAGQTNVKIKFQYVGDDGADIDIDDISVSIPPALPPSCAANIVSTPNPTCGNFATELSWDAAATSTGYFLTVGTTTGGTDVVNNVDVGLVTSYVVSTQSPGTVYYWTVVPYNEAGSSTGCTENTYTTFATPCYCDSLPTSVDGNGITNVLLGTTNVSNLDATYTDSTATVINFAQGITSNVQITFETGYTYDANIWIDFNNDYDFEDAGELVKTGVASTNATPTTLNASFIMPATAPLGQHRMRIGTADSGQFDPDPCYSGSYGATIDYTVNIIAASCVPPAATAVIVPACGSNQYSVDVTVTALGNGTPTISDGTTTWPVSATGVVTVGPYASGSLVTLNLLHGSDSLCNLSLGDFIYTCPPTNDDCANATVIASLPYTFTQNDAVAATNNAGFVTGCTNGMNDGLWYKFDGNGGDITVTATPAGIDFDPQLGIYTGTCGTFTCVGTVDVGFEGDPETYTITGSVLGTTYYVNIGDYSSFSNNPEGNFDIDVTTTLAVDTFGTNGFSAYPNPVKNILNISNSTSISKVQVVNLLGQEMIVKSMNETQGKLDVSELSAGTYLVKVTSDNQVKTIKIVKE
jgi:hypothetical protein